MADSRDIERKFVDTTLKLNQSTYYERCVPKLTVGVCVRDVNLASGLITIAVVAVGVVCVRGGASPVAAAAATIAGTIAVGKVASPQYALWVLPFFSLLTVRVLWWAVFTASELAFWVAFFAQGYLGVHGGHLEQAAFLRALVLVALIPVFLRSRDVVPISRGEPEP